MTANIHTQQRINFIKFQNNEKCANACLRWIQSVLFYQWKSHAICFIQLMSEIWNFINRKQFLEYCETIKIKSKSLIFLLASWCTQNLRLQFECNLNSIKTKTIQIWTNWHQVLLYVWKVILLPFLIRCLQLCQRISEYIKEFISPTENEHQMKNSNAITNEILWIE